MKVTISKIDEVLFSGEAETVVVPGVDGELAILANHMPLITTLRPGVVTVKTREGENSKFTIKSGFLEIGKSETVILV